MQEQRYGEHYMLWSERRFGGGRYKMLCMTRLPSPFGGLARLRSKS